MLDGLGLKKYNMLGTTDAGISIYYQNQCIYIIFPEDVKCDFSIGFYLHIYEYGEKTFYRRDFNYNKIKRDLYTSNVVVINNVKNMERLDFGQWDGKFAINHKSFIVKKKIVFHIDHYGGLINMIALRNSKHLNDICILIASVGDDNNNIKILQLLQEFNVFEEVITIFPNSHQLMKMQNSESIVYEIQTVFDTYLCLAGINLSEIDKVYTSFDINGLFTLYLDIKKKHYTIVELAENQLEFSWRKVDLVKQNLASESYNNMMLNRGIFDGTSKFCEGVICFKDTFLKQKKYRIPVEFIDFSDEIRKFPTQLVETILAHHGVDVNKIKEGSILILPNSKYMFKSILNDKWEDDRTLAKIYSLLADYYSQIGEDDIIVIKPHPLTDISFEKYIPNVRKLPKEVPIEIINAFGDMRIKQVLSINTTAIEKIGDCIDEAVEAGKSFVSYMNDLPALWFIANFFDWREVDQNIYDRDFLEACLNRLNYISENINKIEANSICILKDIYSVENDRDYDYIFMFGKCREINMKKYEQINMRIKVCPYRENSVMDNVDSVMTIFAKNSAEFINKIDKNVQKKLFCSGANVNYYIIE